MPEQKRGWLEHCSKCGDRIENGICFIFNSSLFCSDLFVVTLNGTALSATAERGRERNTRNVQIGIFPIFQRKKSLTNSFLETLYNCKSEIKLPSDAGG
jgi:hypothetical protein